MRIKLLAIGVVFVAQSNCNPLKAQGLVDGALGWNLESRGVIVAQEAAEPSETLRQRRLRLLREREQRQGGEPQPSPQPDPQAGQDPSPQPPPQARNTSRFPVIFTDKAIAKKTGIAVANYGNSDQEIEHYRNKCYEHPALYDISVSDKFLAAYKAKGFTLQSLCLGLNSSISFNPETGKKLRTFMIVDEEELKRGRTLRGSSATSEIPYDVPLCFRNGRPYADCTFKRDPITGKKLTSARTQQYRELGQRIDDYVKAQRASGKWAELCNDVPEPNGQFRTAENAASFDEWERRIGVCARGEGVGDWLLPDGEVPVLLGDSDERLWEHQRMIDISPHLKDGYGYALYMPSVGGNPDPKAKDLKSYQEESLYGSSVEAFFQPGEGSASSDDSDDAEEQDSDEVQ